MIQSVTTKKTLLSVVCAAALTGCLDDPYQEPVVTPPPPPSGVVSLYGDTADGTFQLAILDSSDTKAIVESTGSVIQGNITATNVTHTANGPVNIQVRNGQKARVMLESANSSHVALDVQPENATVQFDTRVMNKPATAQDIFLTAQKEIDTDTGKVSLARTLTAAYGSGPQTVKVPLHCFTGMDYTNVISPFALETSSDINMDISNIRILTESVSHADVLNCQNNNPLLQADDTNDAFKTSSILRVGPVTTGWASAITNWMTVGSSTLHWGGDFIRIEYTDAPKGENGGLVLMPHDGVPRDLSDYVNTGVLQFMFSVSSYGDHPTKRFQVQMESATYGNSEPYFLEAGFAEGNWQQVNIPLRDLFTRADGSLNINMLQNVLKPMSILPEWVDSNHSLQGIDFSIGSIQIIVPN